jgi:hypothetical protein
MEALIIIFIVVMSIIALVATWRCFVDWRTVHDENIIATVRENANSNATTKSNTNVNSNTNVMIVIDDE